MKTLRYMISVLTLTCSFSLSAQDWQIGGGYDESEERREGVESEEGIESKEGRESGELSAVESWFRNYAESPVALTLGYVNKGWTTDMNGYTVHENFWGERNKKFHGLQLGFSYQPTLWNGLGLHTGLFYEAYVSFSDVVDEAGFDDFTEHNVYIPAHAMFRVPLSYDCSLSLYGGLGINWAIVGVFSDEYEYYDKFDGVWYRDTYEEYQSYGNGNWPHHLNFSAEIGARVKIKNWQVSFTYSRGLTNHNLYRGYKTRQDKLSISVGWLLPIDDLLW